MIKEQVPPSNTKVPEPLNIFVKKTHLRGDKGKDTLRELLDSSSMPFERLQGCLPVAANVNKCDDARNKIAELNGAYSNNNNNKQLRETVKEESCNHILGDDDKEKMDEEEGIQRLNSLMDEVKLSFDGGWLRKHLKSPLKMAIKEIVAKKPCDPVGYLGFWLLNYRRLQEVNQWQLEEKQELDYYRSLVHEPVSEIDEQVSVDKGEEEEEETRDWNFKYYDTVNSDLKF